MLDAIKNIINGYDLNRIAHPEHNIATNVTNMDQFKGILHRCEIIEDDLAVCRNIAKAYFSLRSTSTT
jgi:hypothetical protein